LNFVPFSGLFFNLNTKIFLFFKSFKRFFQGQPYSGVDVGFSFLASLDKP